MKYPTVIVEGCDGSGKSTLISTLDKVPGIPQLFRIARSRRPRSPYEIERETYAMGLVRSQGIGVVMDRNAYISEPIYGTIVRNRPVVFWDDEPPTFLCSKHILIIYCRPSNEAVKTGIQTNPQMEGVMLKVDEILMAYDLRMSLLKNCGANVRVYNYQTDSAMELWQQTYGLKAPEEQP